MATRDTLTTFAPPLLPLTATQGRALHDFETAVHEGRYRFEPAVCTCGAADGEVIASSDRYGIPTPTRLCPHCGVMRTSPRLDEASAADFYESIYRRLYLPDGLESEAFFAQRAEMGRVLLDRLEHDALAMARGTVVEVGCGTGHGLAPFAERGWRVVGTDVDLACMRSGPPLLSNAVAAALPRLPIRADCVDLVVLRQVLEHLSDPVESLAELGRLIRHGGVLVVEVPGVYAIRSTYGNPALFFQNAHVYHFTLRSVAAVASRAGFELVDGDEQVTAIFRRSDDLAEVDVSDEAARVRQHLDHEREAWREHAAGGSCDRRCRRCWGGFAERSSA
ncbi:MAG: class I SAM-dependent methyltransferase [Acidimicrobiales bacterium]